MVAVWCKVALCNIHVLTYCKKLILEMSKKLTKEEHEKKKKFYSKKVDYYQKKIDKIEADKNRIGFRWYD